MKSLEERQEEAKQILKAALEQIDALGIEPCIRDGAYEPDGMPIDLDNVDLERKLGTPYA